MSQYEDRSRGKIRAPASASRRHRVTRPSDRADCVVSPLRAGTDWRGIGQCWLGPAITIGVLALWLFVIPAFFGGM